MAELKLSVGMYGDEVKLLHGRLRQHGFDIPIAEVDRRFFGPATRDAVQKCQAEHGLNATGVVDETTAAALIAATAKGSGNTEKAASPPVEQPMGPVPSSFKPAGTRSASSFEAPGNLEAALESAVGRAETDQHRVEGRIFFDYGLPAGEVAVRL